MSKCTDPKEWKDYSRTILGKVERKVKRKTKEGKYRNGEIKLGREKFGRIMKRLKVGKTTVEDGIASEV